MTETDEKFLRRVASDIYQSPDVDWLSMAIDSFLTGDGYVWIDVSKLIKRGDRQRIEAFIAAGKRINFDVPINIHRDFQNWTWKAFESSPESSMEVQAIPQTMNDDDVDHWLIRMRSSGLPVSITIQTPEGQVYITYDPEAMTFVCRYQELLVYQEYFSATSIRSVTRALLYLRIANALAQDTRFGSYQRYQPPESKNIYRIALTGQWGSERIVHVVREADHVELYGRSFGEVFRRFREKPK